MKPMVLITREARLDLAFVQHFIQISTCLVNMNKYP